MSGSASPGRALRLSVPPQTQDEPTFFDGSATALTRWLDELPIRNPLHLASALHKALVELNRCRTPFARRFAQLETIRPWAHVACSTVARTRNQRPLLLSETDRRVATLLQRVQYQVAIGYRICIVEALRAGVDLGPGADRSSDAGLVTVAIHRALEELAHTLLRSVQCYVPPPKKLWEQLHNLYSLAELKRVADEIVHDPEHELVTDTRIGDAYERPLLLAAAQPNMLRHERLGALFTVLEDWTRHVEVEPVAAQETPVILVDLASDAPPKTAAGYRETAGSETRSVRTEVLIGHLNRQLEGGAADEVLSDVGSARHDLLRHVIQVWGELTDRAHERTPTSGVVDLCVGLRAVHFRAGEDRSLAEQLRSRRVGSGQRVSDEPDLDPFAGASDIGGARSPAAPDRPRRVARAELPVESELDHPISEFDLADHSPGGYGLRVRGEAPATLHTGELIGVRAEDADDWEIAVVRWVANDGAHGRLGTELLAARGETAGARIIAARGTDQTWQRVILLPGIEALGEGDAIIAPVAALEPGQKIALNQDGQETKFRITDRVQQTPGFDHFRVQPLGAADTVNATGIEVEDISEEDEAALIEAFGLDRTGG